MNKNLEEISDGKRYGLNDMVRAACNDCAGCSSCCEDMGESIILDPLDIYELTKNLNTTFENLLKEQITFPEFRQNPFMGLLAEMNEPYSGHMGVLRAGG